MFIVVIILLFFFATGHLDPSSETKDMEQGTSLELPYWIVKTLSNREVNVVEVEPPKIFKENYRSTVHYLLILFIYCISFQFETSSLQICKVILITDRTGYYLDLFSLLTSYRRLTILYRGTLIGRIWFT
jgi:hypothetical protein